MRIKAQLMKAKELRTWQMCMMTNAGLPSLAAGGFVLGPWFIGGKSGSGWLLPSA